MNHLPNEITNTKQASFAITFGLFWRLVLFVVVFSIITSFIPPSVLLEHHTIIMLAEILVLLVAFWFIINNTLSKGFGTVKYILMKKEHYHELLDKVKKL